MLSGRSLLDDAKDINISASWGRLGVRVSEAQLAGLMTSNLEQGPAAAAAAAATSSQGITPRVSLAKIESQQALSSTRASFSCTDTSGLAILGRSDTLPASERAWLLWPRPACQTQGLCDAALKSQRAFTALPAA
jgi:hypothetical protein